MPVRALNCMITTMINCLASTQPVILEVSKRFNYWDQRNVSSLRYDDDEDWHHPKVILEVSKRFNYWDQPNVPSFRYDDDEDWHQPNVSSLRLANGLGEEGYHYKINKLYKKLNTNFHRNINNRVNTYGNTNNEGDKKIFNSSNLDKSCAYI